VFWAAKTGRTKRGGVKSWRGGTPFAQKKKEFKKEKPSAARFVCCPRDRLGGGLLASDKARGEGTVERRYTAKLCIVEI
jgi:hypothetical protein